MANESMGLIGRKVGMTQFFREDGEVVAVTLVETGPCPVLQVKTADGPDGYNALQLGFGTQKESRVTKPLRGHYAKTGSPIVRHVREIRVSGDKASGTKAGDVLKAADVFEIGAKVDVIGTSKGRGFAGVMKKFNFRGFIRSHGTHEFFRHGGSIGTRLTPGMVFKGKKMPGQLGNKRVTVQNLVVERIDEAKNLVMLRGGVPGPNGGFVIVRHAAKG